MSRAPASGGRNAPHGRVKTRLRSGLLTWLRAELPRLDQGHAEPQAVVPEARRVPAAVRRPAAVACDAPTAAAEDAVGGPLSHLGVGPSRQLLLTPVPTPLPHVSVHVVETPRIRLVATNRRRASQGFGLVRPIVRKVFPI